MTEHPNLNLFPNPTKLINKKITDSLQSKKQFSICPPAKDLLKDHSQPIDMELCEIESVSNLLPNISTKRSISQLFSEFNIKESNPAPVFSNPKPFFKVNHLPSPSSLTPVQEEPESNQSSGQNVYKRQTERQAEDFQQFNRNSLGLKDLKRIVWKNKTEERFEVSGKQEKKTDLRYWRERLKSSCKEFLEFERECSRVIVVAECLETKIQMLMSASHKPNPSKVLPVLQDCFKNIDFSSGPYKYEERWIQTWTKSSDNLTFTYFRHLGSYYLSDLISKLVLVICTSTSNQFVDFELFQQLPCDDLTKIWTAYKSFLSNLLSNLSLPETLEKTSSYWINFVQFSEKFEIFKLSFDYTSLTLFNRSFKLQGCLYNKSWEYLCTFYNLMQGVDIIEEISKIITSLFNPK